MRTGWSKWAAAIGLSVALHLAGAFVLAPSEPDVMIEGGAEVTVAVLGDAFTDAVSAGEADGEIEPVEAEAATEAVTETLEAETAPPDVVSPTETAAAETLPPDVMPPEEAETTETPPPETTPPTEVAEAEAARDQVEAESVETSANVEPAPPAPQPVETAKVAIAEAVTATAAEPLPLGTERADNAEIAMAAPAELTVSEPAPEAVRPEATEAEPVRPDETVIAMADVPVPTPRPEYAKPAAKKKAKAKKPAKVAKKKRKKATATAKPTKKAKPAKRIKPKKKRKGSGGNATADARRGTADGQATATRGGKPGKARKRSSAGNASVSNYPGKIVRKLRRSLRYPRAARARRITGEVHVRFVVSANGSAGSIRVVRSSGSPILDRAAIDTVRRAAPFPAIPRGAGRRSWPFTVPLAFRR